MAELKWQDIPDNSSPKTQPTSASGNPPVVSESNPWFAVTMGLVGIIAGYIISNLVH